MNKIRKTIYSISLIVALCFTAAVLFAGRNSSLEGITIRIGLFENVDSVNISCEGNFKVIDENGKMKIKLSSRDVYLVSAHSNDIVIRNKLVGRRIEINSMDERNKLRVNGKKYRGNITIVLKDSKKLTIINELGLEEYLYGVLPKEISPEWPEEAMKAQAVVSRTFAIKNMGKHESNGYDLSATVFCQVYGGMECEDARTNKAVDTTKGKIIKYKGELITAVFHSTCGGFTENVSNVWENDNPPRYLRGTRCLYCKNSPQYKWRKFIKKETIRKKLEREGYNVGRIKKIKVANRSTSKRAIKFNVYHTKGKLSIPSNKLRLAVGQDLLKSTFLKLKNHKDEIKFVGRGWGHGVGLCQWGAKEMAERGYSCRRIIKKYFPGTRIKKI